MRIRCKRVSSDITLNTVVTRGWLNGGGGIERFRYDCLVRGARLLQYGAFLMSVCCNTGPFSCLFVAIRGLSHVCLLQYGAFLMSVCCNTGPFSCLFVAIRGLSHVCLLQYGAFLMSVHEALQLYRIANMYPPAHAVFRTAVKETHCRVH